MTYSNETHGPMTCMVTNTALVRAIDAEIIALVLDTEGRLIADGEPINVSWEGGPQEARQLAAALLNGADEAEAQRGSD